MQPDSVVPLRPCWRPIERRDRTARSRCAGPDAGSISAFVVCLVVVFVACAGLVLDGGRYVAARARAASVAEQAARDGVQEVHGLHNGLLLVNTGPASARAERYLSSVGAQGAVVADPSSVTVTVAMRVQPLILGIFGVGARTARVTRTAQPVDR